MKRAFSPKSIKTTVAGLCCLVMVVIMFLFAHGEDAKWFAGALLPVGIGLISASDAE